MSATQQYVKLAQALPPRLKRFLARYPPPSILAPEPTPASSDPAQPDALPSQDGSITRQTPIDTSDLLPPSPFKPFKHPITGKWHNPTFSLRRQADLSKMARRNGIEEMLPHSIKGTEERIRKRSEHGLRVKGTGVGQRVKGKESERTMKARLEKRRQAMLEMPRMIQTWKERGHGRGWKKWPK